MANVSELMKYDKKELAEAASRLAGRVRKIKEKAKEGAENFTEMAVAGGAAFGVGYYMGTLERDGASGEELQFFGIDRDLAIGGAAALVGLTGMAGKKMSGAARAAGTGILSYSLGNMGNRMAKEAS